MDTKPHTADTSPTPSRRMATCCPGPAYRPHGTGVRGADLLRRSPQYEGRFGRMFRTLPAAHFTSDALTKLAHHMTAKHEAAQTPETESDDEENSGISAGYTYFGQFLDHDLTFDPASSLQRKNDPDALTDYRTPRFDLDSVYGRGPDDQPYLYADDGLHMLVGKPVTGSAFDPNTRDLPRNTPNLGDPARALLGDPRNDENSIVSQLHSTMLRFHNRVADLLHAEYGPHLTTDRIQQTVRWHYQWAILHDFLPTILDPDTLISVLPQLGISTPITIFTPNLKYFHWKDQPYMPIEFSAAAYRFGHSMVRPVYRLNTQIPGPPTDLPDANPPGRFLIFPDPSGDPTTGLTGFHALASERAVDWSLFFPMDGAPLYGPTRVQPAYKIDTSLVNPLGSLPESVGPTVHSLALRNLKRGFEMGLPSGQSVARQMGMAPIADSDLRVGKANADDAGGNPTLVSLSREFQDNAPLWFYVLAEAQQQVQQAVHEGTMSKDQINALPIRLGPVGSRIIAEVFVGLMYGDSHSYMQQDPGWTPFSSFMRDGKFGIAEMILQAKLA